MGMPPGGMGMEQQQPGPGQYAGGTISSIQNDENGTPAWILSGLWKGALTNTADKSNQDFSTPTVSNNNDNLPTKSFHSLLLYNSIKGRSGSILKAQRVSAGSAGRSLKYSGCAFCTSVRNEETNCSRMLRRGASFSVSFRMSSSAASNACMTLGEMRGS